MMGNLLEGLGAVKVFAASDGRAALEILESLDPPIDVVLSDLNMPGMDGIEFIRHLSESSSPVSLIVASEQDPALIASVSTMARAYGVNLLGALEKPLTARKLADALAKAGEPAAAERVTAAGPFTIAEIERGISAGEIVPFYQPKVDVASGTVRGVEALARWRHPEHGIVTPSAFLPVLESASRLDMLTFHMLAKGAIDCLGWRAAGFPLKVAVNLSPTSLGDPSLADRIVAAVTREGLQPQDMVLEVTETAVAANGGAMLENLTRLRMKGFGLAIDDFGTGYSSMQAFTRIPFTELKIDATFVRDAPRNAASRAVLESSLEVAAKLGLTAVAEGVESKAELNLLRDLGCALAQGYYLARPMNADDLLQWLIESPREAVGR